MIEVEGGWENPGRRGGAGLKGNGDLRERGEMG